MKRLLILLLSLPVCLNGQTPDWKNLEDYLNFRAEKGRYSGVTTIFYKNKKVFESVKGLANRAWSVPNTADTRFNLASVTKMFTATAIGILIDQEKLKPADKLIKYFSDFPKPEIAAKVSIEELLSHTSGLNDFFFGEAYLHTDRSRLRKLADYDRFFSSLEQGAVPENRILYSNANYVILGRVIEKVSGRDFYEFVQTEVFDKAGMKGSGFFEADQVIPRLAEGYFVDAQASAEFGVPNDGQLRKNTFLKAVKGMPAGGAYSTTHDMQEFFHHLRKGIFFSQNLLMNMTEPNPRGYNLGFQVYEQEGIKVWGHSGGFYGVSTMAFYLPEQDYTFISLTNSDFAAQPVFDRFINILSGQPTYSPVSMPADQLEEFSGIFEVYEGEMNTRQISIEAQSDRLLFDKNLEFFPIGPDRFFDIDNDPFTLSFQRDEKGTIQRFIRADGRRFSQKAKKIEVSNIRSLTALTIAEDVLQQYLGSYQFGQEGMMAGHKPQITVQDGGLMIDNMMRFLPYEKDRFFLEDDIGMKLEFQRNTGGEITGIHVLRETEVVGRVKRLKN